MVIKCKDWIMHSMLLLALAIFKGNNWCIFSPKKNLNLICYLLSSYTFLSEICVPILVLQDPSPLLPPPPGLSSASSDVLVL